MPHLHNPLLQFWHENLEDFQKICYEKYQIFFRGFTDRILIQFYWLRKRWQ